MKNYIALFAFCLASAANGQGDSSGGSTNQVETRRWRENAQYRSEKIDRQLENFHQEYSGHDMRSAAILQLLMTEKKTLDGMLGWAEGFKPRNLGQPTNDGSLDITYGDSNGVLGYASSPSMPDTLPPCTFSFAKPCGFSTVAIVRLKKGVQPDAGAKLLPHCSGVRVSNDHILTAAHCMKNKEQYNYTVLTEVNGASASYAVDDVSLFEHEGRTIFDIATTGSKYLDYGDLAILHLKNTLQTSHVSRIATTHKNNQWGGMLWTIGYGNGPSMQNLAVMDYANVYRRRLLITLDHLDTIQRNTVEMAIVKGGICAGDSGGGVFMQAGDDQKPLVVAGIISNSRDSGTCTTQAGTSIIAPYAQNPTRVVRLDTPSVREWIRKTTNGRAEFAPASPKVDMAMVFSGIAENAE